MSTGIEIGIVLELAAIVIALLRIGDALREREGEYTRACLESVQLQAELAQARAEIRSLEESLSSHEVSTSYIKKVESERDTLRAQLEEQK